MCDHIYIYICILFWILKSCIQMPEDGHYNWNMYHILTRLIKFVMGDCSPYVSFKMIYYDGINFTIIFTKIKLIKFSGTHSSLWSNYGLFWGFLHFVAVICFNVLVKCTASHLQCDWTCSNGCWSDTEQERWFEGVWSITEGSKRGEDCKDQMGVSYLQGDTFLDFTSGICGNNVDGN